MYIRLGLVILLKAMTKVPAIIPVYTRLKIQIHRYGYTDTATQIQMHISFIYSVG